jgi:hypothetical protein
VWPSGLADQLKVEEPSEEDPDYECNVRPAASPAARLMAHLYHNPSCAANSTLCLRAFPKRKGDPVVFQDKGTEKVSGVYLEEEPSKLLPVTMKAVLSFALSGVAIAGSLTCINLLRKGF